MAITKEKKKKIVEELKKKIEKQKTIIFVNFSGLEANDFTLLRKKLKLAGDEIKVAKKTLAQIAFKDKKMEVDSQMMEGEVAFVFGYNDEILTAKNIFEFSQSHPHLKILAGIFENKFFDKEKIIELAKLPSRQELLSRLLFSFSAPLSNFLNVLESNIKGLLYILLAKAKKES